MVEISNWQLYFLGFYRVPLEISDRVRYIAQNSANVQPGDRHSFSIIGVPFIFDEVYGEAKLKWT